MIRRSEQLESEAEQIRTQLANSFEELCNRASPSALFQRVIGLRKASASEFARGLGRAGREMRKKPLLLAVVSSIAWMFTKKVLSRSIRRERVSVGERLGEGLRPTGAGLPSSAKAAESRGAERSPALLQYVQYEPSLSAGLVLAAGAVVLALALSSVEQHRSIQA